MVEVASGNIASGIRYSVGNITTPPGTGTITYNGTTYAIGASFLGQPGITTYTATLTAKVYQDDAALDFENSVTAELSDEITPYPETLQFLKDVTAENFNENDEIVFPEMLEFKAALIGEALKNRSQIIRITN